MLSSQYQNYDRYKPVYKYNDLNTANFWFNPYNASDMQNMESSSKVKPFVNKYWEQDFSSHPSADRFSSYQRRDFSESTEKYFNTDYGAYQNSDPYGSILSNFNSILNDPNQSQSGSNMMFESYWNRF